MKLHRKKKEGNKIQLPYVSERRITIAAPVIYLRRALRKLTRKRLLDVVIRNTNRKKKAFSYEIMVFWSLELKDNGSIESMRCH